MKRVLIALLLVNVGVQAQAKSESTVQKAKKYVSKLYNKIPNGTFPLAVGAALLTTKYEGSWYTNFKVGYPEPVNDGTMYGEGQIIRGGSGKLTFDGSYVGIPLMAYGFYRFVRYIAELQRYKERVLQEEQQLLNT